MILNIIDAHSAGAPCRIVSGGLDSLDIVGETMLEKKRYVEEHHDWLRTALLQEPRGHPALNADLAVPPCDPTADIGLIIINQRPTYPKMSGGNILCFVTSVLEGGLLPIDRDSPITTVRVDTPAGVVVARATCEGNRVKHVAVENVPSYATHLDHELEVPGLGTVSVDVAYGGMFYALVAAEDLGVELTARAASHIADLGEQVRGAALNSIVVDNPAAPAVTAVDAVMVFGPPRDPRNHGRSAVVMPMLPDAPKGSAGGTAAIIDRCPCGTGTSAQMAVLHAKGLVATGQEYCQESLIDTTYEARVVRSTMVGDRAAVVPELIGSAHVIARSEILISDDDPLRYGFTVGDIWPAATAT